MICLQIFGVAFLIGLGFWSSWVVAVRIWR